MDKNTWLLALKDVFLYVFKGLSTAKTVSKLVAKYLIKFVLRLSGTTGLIASYLLPKAIEWGLIELKELVDEAKDKKTLKDHAKETPNGNTEKRKELEKSILEGK